VAVAVHGAEQSTYYLHAVCECVNANWSDRMPAPMA
jgi:hypothetical protein